MRKLKYGINMFRWSLPELRKGIFKISAMCCNKIVQSENKICRNPCKYCSQNGLTCNRDVPFQFLSSFADCGGTSDRSGTPIEQIHGDQIWRIGRSINVASWMHAIFIRQCIYMCMGDPKRLKPVLIPYLLNICD